MAKHSHAGDRPHPARLAELPLEIVEIDVAGTAWKLETVTSQDALVDAADDLEHLPYGFLVWESAVGLARHLAHKPSIVAGKRTLEVGCGVGLPGLVAQSLGARVLQTDHQPGVLTIAAHNGERNGVIGAEQALQDWQTWTIAEQFDAIIGADVLYNPDMHYYLDQIFCRNLKPAGELILADPGRNQAIVFLAEMEKKDWLIDVTMMRIRLDHEGQAAHNVDVAIMSCRRGRQAPAISP